MPIVRNSFIQMSKLPNVKGRISYILSKARQENLYAVYETTDRKFWRELAMCNQEEFRESGTKGICIEARELIIALPESFVDYEPDKLLKLFTEHFKQNYGVECISALHHNKRKTNYHIHLIFSERKLLDEPVEKIATRNMFYDENGKHVRTKKEILDEAGQFRSGCKIIPKGEVYERTFFTIKDSRFKSDSFLDEVKRSYTDLINIYVKDDKQKLKVFDRNGVYLPTKKIGKNNPKAEQIPVKAVNSFVEAKSEPVPEMPKKSELASKYPRLTDIYHKLERQNTAIYERKLQIANVEKKIARAKGIFKAKQRKELQEQAEELKTQIANMKQYLSSVVQGYGYKNVKEFLAEYKASKVEYGDYRKAVAEWEKLTGEKVDDSLKAKLQQKQQQVKEQYRHTEYHKKNDRGAR